MSPLLEMSPELRDKLVVTALFVALFLLARVPALRTLNRTTDDHRALYQWRKTITYVTFALGILVVGRVWSTGFASLATFLGLLSAGLGAAIPTRGEESR